MYSGPRLNHDDPTVRSRGHDDVQRRRSAQLEMARRLVARNSCRDGTSAAIADKKATIRYDETSKNYYPTRVKADDPTNANFIGMKIR